MLGGGVTTIGSGVEVPTVTGGFSGTISAGVLVVDGVTTLGVTSGSGIGSVPVVVQGQ